MYSLKSYNYHLPQHCIAQTPVAKRDESRLLVVDCLADKLYDRRFVDLLDLVKPGDLLVVNDTRVFPARLLGHKPTGGKVELFILQYPALPVAGHEPTSSAGKNRVLVTGLIKSSKRPKVGGLIVFADGVEGRCLEFIEDGKVVVELSFSGDFDTVLDQIGRVPLPPYISRDSGQKAVDRERYQTVFARRRGAVAAPTAGLHFTDELLNGLAANNIDKASVTLHVGYGTFAPVRVDDIRDHQIHSEFVEVSEECAGKINQTKEAGGKVWAVGTTTARTLEFAGAADGTVQAISGPCDLYIYPGYEFKVIDNLITNFHLPQSSLLFLVSALAGRQRVMAAYEHAVEQNYRFYSYGDAMVIVG